MRRFVSIVVLFVVATSGFFIEEYRRSLPPVITKLQIRAHAVLSDLLPRHPIVERVAVIGIDDKAFWDQLGGTQPTNRRYLARLIRFLSGENPRRVKAGVITVAIRLTATHDESGDNPSRRLDNAALLQAITAATQAGIPVVLPSALLHHRSGLDLEPNIFASATLPKDVSWGFTNEPADIAFVPLRLTAFEWNGQKPVPVDSFALEAARAFRVRKGMEAIDAPGTRIRACLDQQQFIYAGFLKSSAFTVIPSSSLDTADDRTIDRVDGRVVVIGAFWHERGFGRGAIVDMVETPVGPQPGTIVHANYVEALLDGRIQPRVPGWIALCIDLGLGCGLIWLFALHRPLLWEVLVAAALFCLPFLIAYVISVTTAYYIEFIVPVVLLLAHLIFDDYLHARWPQNAYVSRPAEGAAAAVAVLAVMIFAGSCLSKSDTKDAGVQEPSAPVTAAKPAAQAKAAEASRESQNSSEKVLDGIMSERPAQKRSASRQTSAGPRPSTTR